MKFRSLHDLIDPGLVSDSELPLDHDHGAPNDAFVIGDSPAQGSDGPKPWVRPAAVVLVLVAVGLTSWNLSRLMEGPPSPPPPTPFQTKQALYLGVMKVEAYRRVHGVTPESMVQVGLPVGAGYSYQRLDPSRYLLSFKVDGAAIEYDSSLPMGEYFGAPRDMLSLGARGDTR